MKLAYFSPMPPAKTGVATYSRQLTAALREHCELTIFTPTADAAPVDGVRIVDFVRNCSALKELAAFDQVLYHLGNNPWFHIDILRVLDIFHGPICLHDTVLYYLAAGLGKGGLLRELLMESPRQAFASLDEIDSGCVGHDILRYPTPSRYPCLHGVLRAATQVIVHSAASARTIQEFDFGGRIDVVPHLHYAGDFPPAPREAVVNLRRELGYADSDFVFGAFGFIGPTKRLDKVLQALAGLRKWDLPRRPRLLIVGEGQSLDDTISNLDLQDDVQTTGFVSDEQFRRYLGAVDVVANLRYPSHGESSGSLVQAMSYGKVCIVTDHGSFAEIPDSTVVKIPYDEREVGALTAGMRNLIEDPRQLVAVGDAARAHIEQMHHPAAVAARFAAVLAGTARPAPTASWGPGSDTGEYFRRRIAELTPAPKKP